jgi:hypothetical protein
MTEWSKGMAKKLLERKRANELRDAKFIEQQKLFQEDGLRLWEEVQNEIDKEGTALSVDMESNLLTVKTKGPFEMTITADLDAGPQTCQVSFSPVSGKLTFKKEDCSKRTFELAIGRNGKLSFFYGPEPLSANRVATTILEALLQ